MFKFGVICEGPTDYHAIVNYFGNCLQTAGQPVSFVDLLPEMDKSRPPGGYSLVKNWLQEITAKQRYDRYISKGLFAGGLSKTCDALLIHLDTDICGSPKFQSECVAGIGVDVDSLAAASGPAFAIESVCKNWAGWHAATPGEMFVHVFCPAVDNTETWCTAAFRNWPKNPEEFTKQELTDNFMSSLAIQEGRVATRPYAKLSKDVGRRKRYCEATKNRSGRIADQCTYYQQAFDRMLAVILAVP